MIRIFSFFSIICIITYACDTSKGYGSIEGNVYVSTKVLDRGDAGATIDLYKENDTVPLQTAQANVNGDYIFDKVESGNYYLVFKSNSPVSDPRTLLLMFYAYRDWLVRISPNFPNEDLSKNFTIYNNTERNFNSLDSTFKAATAYIESFPKNSLDKVGYKIQGYNFGFAMDSITVEKGKVSRPVKGI